MSSTRAFKWRQPLLIMVVAASARPEHARAQRPISLLSDSMTALYSARNLPVTWRPVLPCLAALSVARTYRVPAFLSATTSDTNNRLQLSQAREMARGIIREIRNALGTRTDSIADGESKLSWRALPAVLTVTGYADGRITRSARGPRADTSASALLLKAFDDASRRGATTMPWRSEIATEPVVATFWLEAPDIDSAGNWPPPDPDQPGLTAFSILEPAHSSVHLVTKGLLRYPHSNEKNQVEGDVYLRFVVDTNGNVAASSAHDVRPTDIGTDPQLFEEEYREFLDATRNWIVTSKFSPETIGGCRIETVVEQRVSFRAPQPRN